MKGLYSNRSSCHDFVANALSKYGQGCDLFIATAFFTDHEKVLELVEHGCRVQMIVRLGPGTSSSALQKLQNRPGVQIRYFNDQSFHPKLYIFGATVALVGSSNLTKSGMQTNQEIAVTVEADDQRFNELNQIFWLYWSEAKVLTDEDLLIFQSIEHDHREEGNHKYERDIEKKMGCHACSNIKRGLEKVSKDRAYVLSYQRRYQTFQDAFRVVYNIYESTGRRMISEQELPLRFEVDQFLSFIRENHAQTDKFKSAPLLTGHAQQAKIQGFINEFLDFGWPYLTEKLAKELYPQVMSVLGTKESLQSASPEQISMALLCINAFKEQARYYGGPNHLQMEFLKANKPARIKDTLGYLLHAKEPNFVVRMADCIFDANRSLQWFGESCVQETFGWVNSQNIPICNGRTLKSLRFLGFNVEAGE